MNPVVFNCILLYVLVVVLSVIQSRFRIIKDNPISFFILLILVPVLVLGKAARLDTWTEVTGAEIFGWTLMLSFLNPKSIVPRINEGYIYAYTLFHWYLLIDTLILKGFTILLVLVIFISVYPTFLIINASLEKRKLEYKNKLILYYWFLFAIFFTYADQVALDIITPIVALAQINQFTTVYVVFTAIQLYYISTVFSLIFVGIPFFHLDRSGESFKKRWADAMKDWKKVVAHKLSNYIEYQISPTQFFFITLLSGILFYADYRYKIRPVLIIIYTFLFPIVFFYFKLTPNANLDRFDKDGMEIKKVAQDS